MCWQVGITPRPFFPESRRLGCSFFLWLWLGRFCLVRLLYLYPCLAGGLRLCGLCRLWRRLLQTFAGQRFSAVAAVLVEPNLQLFYFFLQHCILSRKASFSRRRSSFSFRSSTISSSKAKTMPVRIITAGEASFLISPEAKDSLTFQYLMVFS